MGTLPSQIPQRTISDDTSGLELEQPEDMTGADEQDQSGPHAPLLASSHASSDHDDNDHDESLASELEYSGGWFIWALTFSAGISGLLFGYEYVSSYRTRHAARLILPFTNNPRNFQHRCYLVYFGDHRVRSFRPDIDNTRQKPHHILH